MDTSSPLLVRRDGPVATVTLNRPGTRNALNREWVFARAALTEVAADADLRAVVLQARARASARERI